LIFKFSYNRHKSIFLLFLEDGYITSKVLMVFCYFVSHLILELTIKKTELLARLSATYFAAVVGLFLYAPHFTQARCGSLGSPQLGQTLIDGPSNFQFVRLLALRVVETRLFGTAIVYTS